MIVVLGCDPGPNPGLVELSIWDERPHIKVLSWEQFLAKVWMADLVSMEKFVVGQGTLRKTRGGTEETLNMIGQVTAECTKHNVPLRLRPAGLVKPWATNDRLTQWGVYVPGDHHRDAARHALYAAVHAKFLPRRPKMDLSR